MTRFGLVIAMVCVALACASDEGTPPGEYGQQCDMANPCRLGLTCLNKFCSIACGDSLVCQQAAAGDTCVGGACFTTCQTSFTCPEGLTCTMAASTTGTCRPSP